MTALDTEAALLLEYFIAKYVSDHPELWAEMSFDSAVEATWTLHNTGHLKIVCQSSGAYRIEMRVPPCPPKSTFDRPPLMERLRLHRRIGITG